MKASLNNLALTAVGNVTASAMGYIYDTLQSKIANWGRDNSCRFYYKGLGAGGGLIHVATKKIRDGIVTALKDEASNQFNSLLNGKRSKESVGTEWSKREIDAQEEELKKYGRMEVDGGTVLALDDWGCLSVDALMLGIETDNEITVTQQYPDYDLYHTAASKLRRENGRFKLSGYKTNGPFVTKTLVWYDTTAIINISSDKNVVITKVQGRDFSRKELVSNGDIRFSVSGQMTSGRPDVYPTAEVQKFRKIMQYKGIVKVNNELLDQFGITHIMITDFSLPSKEGGKSTQSYSFSAIGLQPESEAQITEDTVKITRQRPMNKKADERDSGWLKLLKDHMDGINTITNEIADQGAALLTGLLD